MLFSLSLIVVASLVLFPGNGQAQEKSWRFLNWETTMSILDNGDVLVKETHTVEFNGSFSFYTRTIPHKRLDDITEITVFDDTTGRELSPGEYQINSSFFGGDPATEVRLNFSLRDVVQTWSIFYTVEGGIGFFEDHDELYWNVISSDRDVPIEEIKNTIILPQNVNSSAILTEFFEDGVDDGSVQVVDDRTVVFSAGHADPFTDFTTVTGWPSGIITNPGILRVESNPSGADVLVDDQSMSLSTPVGLRRGKELLGEGPYSISVSAYGITSEPQPVIVEDNETKVITLSVFDTFWKKLIVGIVIAAVGLFVMLPLWVGIILFFRWRKTGKDPEGEGTIIARFEAPDKLVPGAIGTLVDENADLKDISASLIDLAVKGYLVIEELPKKRLQKQDYKLIKQKEFANDQTLTDFEQLILEKVIGHKEEVKLSSLRNKFYAYVKTIQKKMYAEVVRHNYFEVSPEKRRKLYRGWGNGLIALGFFGIFFYGLGIPIFLTGIVVNIFARMAPQRTKKGVIATEHARGFELYLDTAERYRVRKMTPETFERFLPYAMVFGIEKKWAAKFKDIYKDVSPSWYHSATPGQAFSAIALTNAINSWSTATTSSLASRPGGSGGSGGFASGSSGFSGGFSGGGGGGGGSSAG